MILAPIAIILLIALLSFGLCMGALALRRSHALAPLMLVMGLLESLKFHVAMWMWVDMPFGGAVTVGSLVSYINLLAVMLVVHLVAGVAAARVMAWGVIGLSLALGALNALLMLLAAQPGVELREISQVAHLASSVYVHVVGNSLLLLGLLGSVLLLEWLRQRGLGLLLALVLTLQVVVQLDTPLFLFLAYGPEKFDAANLVAQAVGKGSMALLFAVLAWLALRGAATERLPVLGPGRLGSLLGAYAFQQDRLEQLERELQVDPLTGLFNRRYLERSVPDILALDQRRGDPSALLMLDLDHFKALNDRHGHAVGDEALRHVAGVLRGTLRGHDSVIRYGGEEFLLLLPGIGWDAARTVAQNVLDRLGAAPLQLADGRTVSLRATVGVALSPADGRSWPALLAAADERLYAGKRAGRSRVVVGTNPGSPGDAPGP